MTTLPAARPARPVPGRVVRFAAVGGATTLAYLVLYAGLHRALGSQAANALALLLTADANTLANRRLTFGLGGSAARAERWKGAAAFLVSLVLTSAALAVVPTADGSAETVVLLAANLAAGVVHFLLLRSWAFADGPSVRLGRQLPAPA